MTIRIIAALLLGLIGLGFYAYHISVALDAVEVKLDQSERAVKTHERIRDADVGNGDVDADTRWLCERSGGRNCGP